MASCRSSIMDLSGAFQLMRLTGGFCYFQGQECWIFYDTNQHLNSEKETTKNTFGICCDWDDGRVWCISLHDDLHQLYSDFNVWDCSHKNMIVFCLLERFNTMHWQGYTDFLLSSIMEVRMLAVCTLESNFWTPDECTSCIHPPFRIMLVSTNSWK